MPESSGLTTSELLVFGYRIIMRPQALGIPPSAVTHHHVHQVRLGLPPLPQYHEIMWVCQIAERIDGAIAFVR